MLIGFYKKHKQPSAGPLLPITDVLIQPSSGTLSWINVKKNESQSHYGEAKLYNAQPFAFEDPSLPCTWFCTTMHAMKEHKGQTILQTVTIRHSKANFLQNIFIH